MGRRELVPIAELVDLERLREGGRDPTPSRIRAALPRGWAPAGGGRGLFTGCAAGDTAMAAVLEVR